MKRLQFQLWHLWKKQYLPQLSRRSKELSPQQNLQTNDVVLVTDTDTHLNHWPLGRITAVYPGPDGLVRAVDVRIDKKTLRRPIRKLVKMPIDQTDVQESNEPVARCGGVCLSEDEH